MFGLQILIAYVSLLPLTIVTEFFSVYMERRFMPNRTFDWKQRGRKMLFEHNLFFVIFIVWHLGSITYNRWSYQQNFEYSWTGAAKEWEYSLDNKKAELFLKEYFQTVEISGSCMTAGSNYMFSSHGDLVVQLCQEGKIMKMKVLPRYFWDTFDNGRSKLIVYEWEKRMKQ